MSGAGSSLQSKLDAARDDVEDCIAKVDQTKVNPSVCVCLFVCMSVRMSVCFSVYLSVCLLLSVVVMPVLFSVSSLSFYVCFFFSVLCKSLHLARLNLAQTYTLTTARTLLPFKVIGHRSRSQDHISGYFAIVTYSFAATTSRSCC